MNDELSSIEVRFSEALITPEDAENSFAVLATTREGALQSLSGWLEVGHLTLSELDNVKSLEKTSGADNVQGSEQIIRAFFRLESLRRALNWAAGRLVGYLSERYDKSRNEGDRLTDSTKTALVKLFTPTTKVDLLYKARRIYEGTSPSYARSSTMVDFRPIYSDDMTVHHGLVAITVEVIVRKPDETATAERLNFQVDLRDIAEMEACLKRARAKIQALRGMLEKLGIVLLNPTSGIREN